MSTINVIRGDSKSLLVRVKNADGSLTALDGYTFRLTVKRQPSDDEVLLETFGEREDDGVHFTLTPQFTEGLDPINYAYDIEMANTDRSLVHTIVIGVISVRADVGGPPA